MWWNSSLTVTMSRIAKQPDGIYVTSFHLIRYHRDGYVGFIFGNVELQTIPVDLKG